jgi:hypothetical protein
MCYKTESSQYLAQFAAVYVRGQNILNNWPSLLYLLCYKMHSFLIQYKRLQLNEKARSVTLCLHLPACSVLFILGGAETMKQFKFSAMPTSV